MWVRGGEGDSRERAGAPRCRRGDGPRRGERGSHPPARPPGSGRRGPQLPVPAPARPGGAGSRWERASRGCDVTARDFRARRRSLGTVTAEPAASWRTGEVVAAARVAVRGEGRPGRRAGPPGRADGAATARVRSLWPGPAPPRLLRPQPLVRARGRAVYERSDLVLQCRPQGHPVVAPLGSRGQDVGPLPGTR